MATRREFESAVRAWATVFMRRSAHEFILATKDSGLSPSQLNTLMRLHYRGPCQISGISDELGLTAAAASQIVERLSGMGLIERSEDPNDRRVRQVTLTSKGRSLMGRGFEARIAWVRELGRRLPADDLASIVEALRRMTEAVKELEAERKPEPSIARSNT